MAYRPATMTRNIVIYQDEGVGEFGLTCLRRFFAEDAITLASAEDVIAGTVFEKAHLFVMPGGADRPYCRKLNGAGNKNIRTFVENGGTYLGLCAGAYYACSSIEFHKGRPDEICERRELALIDAVAIGTLPDLAPYYDGTLNSACIIHLTLPQHSIPALYYGGCTFALHESCDTLASYPGNRPAIIRKRIGKGLAVLSGVHIEYTAEMIPLYPCQSEQERSKAHALSHALSSIPLNNVPDWHSLLLNEASFAS